MTTTPAEPLGWEAAAGATLSPAARLTETPRFRLERSAIVRALQRRLLWDVAVLLALPVLLLLINGSWSAGWVDMPPGAAWVEAGNERAEPPTGWLVNYSAKSLDTPIGWVDPYIYQSFFLDLKGTLNLHEELYENSSYYPSRLPFLLLGNAIYSVAAPETANVVMRLVVFYLATFSLYAAVRMATRNDLAALAAAIGLGVNTYFLWAAGWNYVDGFCIATILLMLALLTKAAVGKTWRAALFAAGFAAATAISANIIVVVVMLPALVWYLSLNAQEQRHPRLASIVWMTAGGLAGFATYAVISQLLMGRLLYLLPQIAFAVSGPTASTRALYPEAGWLVAPAVAVLLSVGLLGTVAVRRARGGTLSAAERFGVTASVVFLVLAAIFAYMEFLSHSNILEHAYTAGYMLPFAYLVAGAVAALLLPRTVARVPVIAAMVLVGLLPFAVSPLRFMPGCPDGCLASGRLQLLLVLTAALVVVSLATRNARAGLALLVVFSLVNVGVADRRVFKFDAREAEAAYNRSFMVFDADAVVRQQDPDASMRYWVDLADPYGWVYAAVAGQNLWNKRLVSLEFPAIRSEVELRPGDRIMLASSGGDDVLLKANEALASRDVHVEAYQTARVQRGRDGFNLFLTRVVSGPSLQPVQVASASR